MSFISWVLLILVVIVAIIVARRVLDAYRERNVRSEAIARLRDADPDFGGLQQNQDEEMADPLLDDLFSKTEKRPDDVEQKLVILYVVAQTGQFFSGKDIQDAMQSVGLCYGDMDIYHAYPYGGTADESTFSVANIVEPGTFDLATMDTFSSPGLSLFLQMPNSINEIKAFDQFVTVARALAKQLQGEVLDDTRSAFLQQTQDQLRDEVVEYHSRLARSH